MSLFLKQSTAVVVSYGPALDKTDGVTEETGLVSALDHATTGIKLSKNGGALTIRHASVTATTYDAYGMYRVTLDTTDTNTLGTLRMAFNEAATCLPVWQDFMVLPANIYDSIVSGSDLIDVSMTQILGTAVSSPATAGILDVNVKNIDNDAASASGTVTFPNATLASTTNITAGTLTTVTTATNLTNLPAAAALEATLTAMKGATFAGATDSLEAIRDRGDAAWATATGFATPTNITAGTITTVTNLTNAPTNGDLTATMKTSVTTAATAATPTAAAVTGAVGSVTAGVTVTTNNDKAGYALTATTGLGNQTANITGNLSGSVGSVTGAVGSVTGAVGSVTGAVGSVTGAVGSVTAAVTLPTIPTNWITEDGIATDAFGALELAAGAASEIAAAISIPSAATIASQVRTELTTELAHITLAKKLLKNRTETDPATGIMTVYDDDGTTPLYTANIYTDVAGATAYAGTAGVNRRNALA